MLTRWCRTSPSRPPTRSSFHRQTDGACRARQAFSLPLLIPLAYAVHITTPSRRQQPAFGYEGRRPRAERWPSVRHRCLPEASAEVSISSVPDPKSSGQWPPRGLHTLNVSTRLQPFDWPTWKQSVRSTEGALRSNRQQRLYADELFDAEGLILDEAAAAWRRTCRPDRAEVVAVLARGVRNK